MIIEEEICEFYGCKISIKRETATKTLVQDLLDVKQAGHMLVSCMSKYFNVVYTDPATGELKNLGGCNDN